MSLVSVIIVNWNSKDFVRHCLASLHEHCRAVPFEVIVVDGASYDGCEEMLAHEFPSVRFIQSLENIGFGRCNNLGAESAAGEYLMLLNPDTVVTDDAIAKLQTELDRLPKAGALGCRLLNRDGSLQMSCVQAYPTPLNQALDSDYLRRRFPDSSLWGISALHDDQSASAPVEAVSGACVFLLRSVFEEIGGFSSEYFMYGEDLDLSYRIRQSGRQVYYVPTVSIVHFGGGSSSQAASNFSTVMMHASVSRFIRVHQGVLAAVTHRVLMGLTAAIRLVAMAPLALFGKRFVQHGRSSARKWLAILRWSLGVMPQPPLRKTPVPATIGEIKHTES